MSPYSIATAPRWQRRKCLNPRNTRLLRRATDAKAESVNRRR